MVLDNSYSPDFWRNLVDYDPESGQLKWKVTIGRTIKEGEIADKCQDSGYRVIKVLSRTFQSHRVIWMIVHGRWPIHEIDHRNCIPWNNRLSNLREATDEQQSWNTRGKFSSKSGLKGVYPSGKRWRSCIRLYGEQKHLGTFDTPEEAHQEYCRVGQLSRKEFFRGQ